LFPSFEEDKSRLGRATGKIPGVIEEVPFALEVKATRLLADMGMALDLTARQCLLRVARSWKSPSFPRSDFHMADVVGWGPVHAVQCNSEAGSQDVDGTYL
jgi:hypothetical protein